MEITNALLAAFAIGKVSEKERQTVRCHLAENPADMQVVFESMDVYGELEDALRKTVPSHIGTPGHDDYDTFCRNLEKLSKAVRRERMSTMYAIAADNTVDHLCDIKCEGIALRKMGIEVSDLQLEAEAEEYEWLDDKGTRLIDVGKLCELHGAKVSRQLDSSLDDIVQALSEGGIVIVSVDEGELVGDEEYEHIEDAIIGNCPDHVVIVVGYDDKKQEITIVDPNTTELEDTYPIECFMDAWEDSNNFMVSIQR